MFELSGVGLYCILFYKYKCRDNILFKTEFKVTITSHNFFYLFGQNPAEFTLLHPYLTKFSLVCLSSSLKILFFL